MRCQAYNLWNFLILSNTIITLFCTQSFAAYELFTYIWQKERSPRVHCFWESGFWGWACGFVKVPAWHAQRAWFNHQHSIRQVWWCVLGIPALERQRKTSVRAPLVIKWVLGQPGLHETLSKKAKGTFHFHDHHHHHQQNVQKRRKWRRRGRRS